MIHIHGESGTIVDSHFHNEEDRTLHLYPPDGGRLVVIGCDVSARGVTLLDDYYNAKFEGRFENGEIT